MAAPTDKYLEALLTLSNNERFADARKTLLKSMGDDELQKLVAQIIHRKFTRHGPEDIASTVLDVIARDDDNNGIDESFRIDDSTATGATQASAGRIRTRSSNLTPIDFLSPELPTTGKRASTRLSKDERKRAKKDAEHSPDEAPENQIKPSLRTQVQQVIGGKPVPVIEIVYWDPTKKEFFPLDFQDESEDSLATVITKEFDTEYLSTDTHVYEWGKLLRLQEKGVESQCCANRTIINRSKYLDARTMGDMMTACDACLVKKRLCARLVKSRW